MPKSNILYNKFQWHFGVVEDRNDPLKLGRLKVRYHGVHTDDKSKLPTDMLPWSTPINPVNSSATSGVGGPVTGIVEGAWVIAFFVDGESYQRPFIMGTIAGYPTVENDPTKGFNDPRGNYPRKDLTGFNSLEESDLSRLSRGDKAETHASLLQKRNTRVTEIPRAVAASVKSVQDDKGTLPYEIQTWDEPHPRGHDGTATGTSYPSKYPYNHVYESEQGHIKEVDDTVNNERLHTQHKSGTYEEIVADGSRSVKIVGDDFEVVVKDKKVFIKGNLDMTVAGDFRTSVQGNMITEVTKDHVTLVRGDKIEHIQGNHVTEILSDRATQINGNNSIRITGNDITTIDKNETISIAGTKTETVTGDHTVTNLANFRETVLANRVTMVRGNEDVGVVGNYNMASNSKLNIKSVSDMTIITDATQLINVGTTQTIKATTQDIDASTGTIDYTTGSIDVATGNITDTTVTLHTHTHPQPADSANNTQSDTSAPNSGT